jgi:RNA polymerase sigma factor (sigma-70 family)
MTDAELLERFVSRHEPAAFEELVRRHGPMVLRVCRRVLHHAQDAEDAFQATFMILARKAGAIAKRGSLASWLYGVAYRVALQTRERAQHHRTAPLGPAEGQIPDNRHPRPDRTPDVRQVLDEELSRLPEKYRAPLVLCFLEGRTNDEAANQLGCSRGTIAARISRGRDRLRDGLVRRGLTVSGVALAALLAETTAMAAIPAVLAAPTVQAAVAIGAGKAVAAGVVSAQASAVTKATLNAMFWAKAKLCAATFAAVVTVAAVPAYFALNQSDPTLVVAYSFSEGKGTTAADASDSRNNATLVGGVSWITGPRPGTGALNFDGKTGLLQLDKSVTPLLGQTATLTCWISTTQTGNGDTSSPAIVGVDAVDDDDAIWGWIDRAGRIGVGAGAGPTAHGATESAQSKQPINDGRWHHVAMTRNLATGEVQMFVDGLFQARAVSGLGIKSAMLKEVGRFESKHNQVAYYFRGSLADLRLYSRVLTAEEIRKLAQ